MATNKPLMSLRYQRRSTSISAMRTIPWLKTKSCSTQNGLDSMRWFCRTWSSTEKRTNSRLLEFRRSTAQWLVWQACAATEGTYRRYIGRGGWKRWLESISRRRRTRRNRRSKVFEFLVCLICLTEIGKTVDIYLQNKPQRINNSFFFVFKFFLVVVFF